MKPRDAFRQESRFSDCGKFRHLLIRQWDSSKPLLPFVLLNPSKAGQRGADGREQEDPTSRKGIGFAQRLGYGGMVFVNLSDYCATDPKEWKAAGYPRSPDCDRYIVQACGMGKGEVICAWGANARGLSRPAEVLCIIRANRYNTMALRLLSDGIPEHPLMLPYSCKPVPYAGLK